MRRYIQRLGKRVLWLLFLEEHEFDGLRLRIHQDAGADSLDQIIAALRLIKDLDPRRYATIARLLPGGIAIIEPVALWAHFDPADKACCLSFDFIEAHDIENIALTIIHELCHARLMDRGIGYEEPIRFRVEKACLRRELAFARLLDQRGIGGCDYVGEYIGQYVGKVMERLENLSPAAYTDTAFRSHFRQDNLRRLRVLKALGPPRWLRRCAVMGLRRRWRREDAKMRKPRRRLVCIWGRLGAD